MEEILRILEGIRPEENFSDTDNFIVDGLLDSFDLLTLVAELDDRFAISIEGTDIIPQNFQNIASIKDLLTKYNIVL